MAGSITALRFQKRNPERVNVYLDGRFAFGLPALDAARLQIGEHLSDDEIEQLQAADLVQRTYDRSVRFLSYRPRSKSEVRRYLKRAEVEDAVIDVVLERLARQGYVDDAEFARFWVDNRQRFKPRGIRALRHELYQKGVDAGTIEEAVAGVDVAALAYEAGRVRAIRLSTLAQNDAMTFARRLSAYLLRRGFDYEVVRNVVGRLAAEYGASETGEETDDA